MSQSKNNQLYPDRLKINSLLNLLSIIFSQMTNKVLFFFLLLLFLSTTAKRHSIDAIRQDLDKDINWENEEDISEEIVSELAEPVGAAEGLD